MKRVGNERRRFSRHRFNLVARKAEPFAQNFQVVLAETRRRAYCSLCATSAGEFTGNEGTCPAWAISNNSLRARVENHSISTASSASAFWRRPSNDENISLSAHSGSPIICFIAFQWRLDASPQLTHPPLHGKMYWMLSCGLASNRHWNAMKHMMGDPEWAESEMFSSFEGRLQNADALEAVLIEWFSTRTRKHLFDIAQAGHVPSFPVNSPAEIAHNEQYAARRYFVDCDHSVAGRVRMPGAPFIMSRTPWRIRSAAPRLGEHNLKILGERLGLASDEIEAMATKAASLVTGAFHPLETLETAANLRQPS